MKTLNQIQQMSKLITASSGNFFDFLCRRDLSDKIIGQERASAALHENREFTTENVVQEKADKQSKTIEDEIIAQMAKEYPSIFLT
jgi:hypothetical protein